MTNENEETEENFYVCMYCHALFDDENQRDEHVFKSHMHEVEQKLSEIANLAQQPEHKQTIQEWKDEKRKELLLKISQERPQLLHEIQTSPHADEMIDKMIEEDLFKKALKTETLSSFDAMWLRHPKFEEIYRASREKPEHQPQTGDSTGQTEEFFESPQSMIDKTKSTNIRGKESLSEEDMKKKHLVLILYSLLRKRKSN